MAHLEVVKSKPVRVPVEHRVKVRVDLGHHEIKLSGRVGGGCSEFGLCAVRGSVWRVWFAVSYLSLPTASVLGGLGLYK